MNRKLFDVLDAALPAALVATIAGACFSGADYLALVSIEQFAERLGWLPAGWKTANAATIYGAVTVTTLLVTGFIGWRMYRMARKTQLGSGDHC